MLVNTGLILYKCRLEIIQNCIIFLPTYIFIEKVINKVKKQYSFWKYVVQYYLSCILVSILIPKPVFMHEFFLSFILSVLCVNFFSFHSTIWDLSYTFVFYLIKCLEVSFLYFFFSILNLFCYSHPFIRKKLFLQSSK